MTDDTHDDDKEVDAPVPAAIIAGVEEELAVPHDEFDVLFPAPDAELEDGEEAFKPPHDDDESDDYPFSGDEE